MNPDVVMGCIWGSFCGVLCVLTPGTNVLMLVLAAGCWGNPLVTGIAISVGYCVYTGLNTGRELLDPVNCSDVYHAASAYYNEEGILNLYFVGKYKQHKVLGLLIGCLISSVFILIDQELSSVPGLSIIGLGVLLVYIWRDPNNWIFNLSYMVLTGFLVYVCKAQEIANPVPLIGLSLFVIPNLYLSRNSAWNLRSRLEQSGLLERSSQVKANLEYSALVSPQMVNQSIKTGWVVNMLAVIFSFVTPGISSSAWGNIRYKTSLARRLINTTSETSIESTGVFLGLYGINYGGSLINAELENLNLNLDHAECMVIITLSWILAMVCTQYSVIWYGELTGFLEGRKLGFNISVNFTSELSQFLNLLYASVLVSNLGMGVGLIGLVFGSLVSFLEIENKDPAIKSFSFLPLVFF